MFTTIFYAFWLAGSISAQLHPQNPAKYPKLPSLREQAQILDEWKAERIARIPLLLKKHGVDAWLVIISLMIHFMSLN